jgi:hypothetical protein
MVTAVLGQARKKIAEALLDDPIPRALKRLRQQFAYYRDAQQLTDASFLSRVLRKLPLVRLQPIVNVDVGVKNSSSRLRWYRG